MEAREYFQGYTNYFWRWEDDAQVLAMPGGLTIAYRDQVFHLLETMAEQGLPAFGAVLLALIATNKEAEDPVAALEETMARCLTKARQYHINKETLDSGIAFLRIVAGVPQRYREGQGRVLLLQTLFADAHNKIARPKARRILAGFSRDQQIKVTDGFWQDVFVADFRTLQLLQKRFPDVQSIIDKMIDLPEPGEDINIPPEDPGTERTGEHDFVEELMRTPETFRIGALIRPLWAGFKIPHFQALPSRQPLGGVADLSNKGALDRLLLSELAHDDQMLLSRLANNEALYLHREQPPDPDQAQRALLIDISLKNWGVPRILSYAAALAITRHPKAASGSEVFAVGQSYFPVSFGTPDELIDALQHVDRSLDAVQGVELLLKEKETLRKAELYYLTSAEVLKAPATQKLLATYSSLFRHIVSVERSGAVRLYRNRPGRRELMQEIVLELNAIWEKKPAVMKREPKTGPPRSGKETCPLLLPNPSSARAVLKTSAGEKYCISTDRLLLRSYDRGRGTKGWQELMKIPGGYYNFEIGEKKDGSVLFLMCSEQSKLLSIVDLGTMETTEAMFNAKNSSPYKNLVFLDDRFYYVGNRSCWEISIDQGLTIKEREEWPMRELRIEQVTRAKEREEQLKVFVQGNVLKNVDTVFISRTGHLVLNQRELLVTEYDVLKLELSRAALKEIESTATFRKSREDTFTFPDGSEVILNPGGMLRLRSSDAGIPDIYVPSVPDAALAAATSAHYCGNSFYIPSKGGYRITLEKAHGKLLPLVVLVKDNCSLSLGDAKNLIETLPGTVEKEGSEAEVMKFVKELRKAGATVRVEPPAASEGQKIGVPQFYQQYIKAFIDNIRKNGTAG